MGCSGACDSVACDCVCVSFVATAPLSSSSCHSLYSVASSDTISYLCGSSLYSRIQQHPPPAPTPPCVWPPPASHHGPCIRRALIVNSIDRPSAGAGGCVCVYVRVKTEALSAGLVAGGARSLDRKLQTRLRGAGIFKVKLRGLAFGVPRGVSRTSREMARAVRGHSKEQCASSKAAPTRRGRLGRSNHQHSTSSVATTMQRPRVTFRASRAAHELAISGRTVCTLAAMQAGARPVHANQRNSSGASSTQ